MAGQTKSVFSAVKATQRTLHEGVAFALQSSHQRSQVAALHIHPKSRANARSKLQQGVTAGNTPRS